MKTFASVLTVTVTVLALGDSLTEGYGLDKSQAWPAVLEARLQKQGRTNVRIVNAGISGSTSASALSRLKWHLKSNPQVLVLALGANDGLRGIDPAQTERNLAAAIEAAQKAGLKVLLTGMKVPPNYGGDFGRRYERVFTDLSSRYKVPLAPFLLEGVAGVRALNLADGVHPNADGHQKMAAYLEPYLLPLL